MSAYLKCIHSEKQGVYSPSQTTTHTRRALTFSCWHWPLCLLLHKVNELVNKYELYMETCVYWSTPVCLWSSDLGLMTAVSKWILHAHCSPTTRLAVMGGGLRASRKKKGALVMNDDGLLYCKYDAVGWFQALGSLLIDFASVYLTSIFIQSGLNILCSLIHCNAFSLYAVFMSRYWPFHIWNTERNISFQK